jgi:hypothetical protein
MASAEASFFSKTLLKAMIFSQKKNRLYLALGKFF